MLPFSDACERNKEPIFNVLRTALASRVRVLEIGSGTGQHAVYFSARLPQLLWYPTEQSPYLADLRTRIEAEGGGNLQAPTVLDVRQAVWPFAEVDAVFTANTLHIMSWGAVLALFDRVAAILVPGGALCIYGPFRYDGKYTSDSNRDFDRFLQSRDPESGLRDLSALQPLGARYGLTLQGDHDLPAFNRLLIFTKKPA